MNKTIIITGASSGVGLAVGNYFYEKKWKVYGLSRSGSSEAKFTIIPTDITDDSQIDNALEKIYEQTQGIDLLLNNAGMGMLGSVEDASVEEIERLFRLNVVACARMMGKVLKNMREYNKGKIINISSLASIMGLPYRGFYSASKASVDMLTEAIRYELLGTNIEVCTVNLGDVQTNIAKGRVMSQVSSPYKESFNKINTEINAEVGKGIDPSIISGFIEELYYKNKLKPHYYFGKKMQKMSILLKKILPQRMFEKIIKSYSKL